MRGVPSAILPRRAGLAALGGLLAAGCSPAALVNALAPRRDIVTTHGVAYAEGPRGLLDIYAPAGAAGAPTVMFLYGGGWDSGDRAMYRFVGAALAAAGIVCAIPDYRLFPDVRFPGFVIDGARALAWVHGHIGDHGGDPGRLLLMGHSAGAQMATLLALDGRYLAAQGQSPAMLRGVIGLAGPYDFLPLRSPHLRDIFGPDPDSPRSQPIAFVTQAAPPMLLATGDADDTVEPRNTQSLAAALRANGVPVQVALYPGIGHIEIIAAMATILSPLAPVRRDVVRYVQARTA